MYSRVGSVCLSAILLKFCLKSFQQLACSFGVGICGQMCMLLEALLDDKEASITILKKMDWAKANLWGTTNFIGALRTAFESDWQKAED